MFKILWFLLIAFICTISIIWILDHNGSIIINWLNYEITTDVLTAFLLVISVVILIFMIAYFLAKISISLKRNKKLSVITDKTKTV